MVLVALAAATLLLFAALAIDTGLVWSTSTQGQAVADSAALAAASTMIDPAGPTVTIDDSVDEAKLYASNNSTVSNPSVTLRDQDIRHGYWDLMSRTFDDTVDLDDPDLVTAAEVTVVLDDAVNDEAPAFFSRLLGRDGYTVRSRAIGYLGFDGDWDPAEFDLPIAIDSCDLVSDPDGCGDDFCEVAQFPPNPCDPSLPDHAGGAGATCVELEFSSTPEQNACWTVFDGDHPAINPPQIEDIIDDGNPNETQAGDSIYLDNGDKSPSVRDIKEKFEGLGKYTGNPAGVDRYPTFEAPPKSDSWVVKLPVVECQDATHCAGGTPQKIVGGVCFEVRQVLAPPYDSDKKIKGRFLCPNDPDPQVQALYQEFCGDQPGDDPDAPGGCNFGDRAERVVLVD